MTNIVSPIANAAAGALGFAGPIVLIVAVLSLLIAGGCLQLRTAEERNAEAPVFTGFQDLWRPTLVFGMFGLVLGIFCGMSGASPITTIVGAATSLAIIYLAYRYSKEFAGGSKLVIASSLVTFFVSTPLAVQYIFHYR